MRSIDHQLGCEPSELKIVERDLPVLKPGQVMVKVACFGVNRADTLQRQGKYPAPASESDILGLEVSGTVVEFYANSETQTIFKLNDKVFGLVAGGGYAEYVAVNEKHLMPVPKNLTMVEAAGIAECFLTAYQSMFIENQLLPSQNVLIHAGASGVGLAAIQLAKLQGCSIAVTASSQVKLDVCGALGADLLVNYQQQNFVDEISQHWQGCDLIIDFVAGDYLNKNLSVLNIDGNILYLAMLAGRYADKLDMAKLLIKRATIKGSTLRNRSELYKAELIAAFSQRHLQDFVTSRLTPNIDSQFAASEIGQAHQRIENNDTHGKLIGCW